ncbi:MAG: tetratricopeptide repeat protein [Bacteroidota bacterium]
MKTVFSLFFIALTTILSAQTTDEVAIKKTVEAETKAWMDRDFDALISHWTQTDNNSFLIVTEDQIFRANDWEEMVASTKKNLENYPNPIKQTLSTSNYIFAIHGDHAYVTYYQERTSPERTVKSHEVRNMLKVNGQWKIESQATTTDTHHFSEDNARNHMIQTGWMLHQMKEYERSLIIAKAYTKAFPDSPVGYRGGGSTYMDMGDKDEAIKMLEEGIERFPDNEGLKELLKKAKAM